MGREDFVEFYLDPSRAFNELQVVVIRGEPEGG